MGQVNDSPQQVSRPQETPDQEIVRVLSDIANRYGTPTYAFDIQRLRYQAEKLKRELPAAVEILYSLKANASLGICDVFADCGIGADVASAGELATAIAAGFPARRVFVAGPFKLPETIAQLRDTPQAILSVDSLSELQALAREGLHNQVVLRLRPDFGSCAVVPAGSESRFGFTCEDVAQCREYLPAGEIDVIGFHVFAGSQILKSAEVNDHLGRALDLSLRAADTLSIAPQLINLGGGFGIPYGANDEELSLADVGAEMAKMLNRMGSTRLVLELGRYLVAQAGWYLTSVVGRQTNQGRPAVVVDGGVHQRADMCGLGLRSKANPPIVLGASPSSVEPTDVLGCLSLPDDVMCESGRLPPLSAGDVLAFSNAGAYGLWSSPVLFHGSTPPAEVAFDGPTMCLMRARQPAKDILDDQFHVLEKGQTANVSAIVKSL